MTCQCFRIQNISLVCCHALNMYFSSINKLYIYFPLYRPKSKGPLILVAGMNILNSNSTHDCLSINPGAAIIVNTCGTNISAIVRDGALSQKTDCIAFFLLIINLEEHQICFVGSKVTVIFLNWCKDYSAFRNCGNCNLTAESPQISTRLAQILHKAIGTLWPKWPTQ